MKEQMLEYLQEGLTRWTKEKEQYPDSEITWKHLDALIAQKEMVEALIGEQVNLQKDGRVTTGF